MGKKMFYDEMNVINMEKKKWNFKKSRKEFIPLNQKQLEISFQIYFHSLSLSLFLT